MVCYVELLQLVFQAFLEQISSKLYIKIRFPFTVESMCLHYKDQLADTVYGHSLVRTLDVLSFLIIHSRGISPSQCRYLHTEQQNTELTYTDIHATSGIRTHDPSVRRGEDSSWLRPRGHCDQ
jgi:hypothetical protein